MTALPDHVTRSVPRVLPFPGSGISDVFSEAVSSMLAMMLGLHIEISDYNVNQKHHNPYYWVMWYFI